MKPKQEKTARAIVVTRIVVCAILAVSLAFHPQACLAVPITPGWSGLSLNGWIAESEAVLLVKWVSKNKLDENKAITTTFEVVQVAKTPEGDEAVRVGNRIAYGSYRKGKPGEFYLLIGGGPPFKARGHWPYWESPQKVTRAGFNSIVQAPSPEAPAQERLSYFLKLLDFSDPLVVNEAHKQLSDASFEELAPLAPQMSRAKLRQWITDPKILPHRVALYGLMLGICGNEHDAELLRRIIIEQADDIRFGIEGVMSGYLLLTGQQGLELLDQTKIKNKQAHFAETYAALQAVRFMWSDAPGKIENERLLQSMRLLLEQPFVTEVVVDTLARWKDWSVQDRLMGLRVPDDYHGAAIEHAIIRYMIRSTKDLPKDETAKTPEHVLKGRAYLETLRKRDPEAVREAEEKLNAENEGCTEEPESHAEPDPAATLGE